MRNKDLLPWNLRGVTLYGFEDKDDTGSESEESEESSEGGDDDDTGDKGEKDQGNDGLKSALRKERQQRRDLEKEVKKLQANQKEKDDKDKSDTDKAKEESAKAQQKTVKLAEKLRTNAVDTEILKIGTKLKFRDIDDALKLIDRDELDVEQDEDDPSDVTVDAASVEAALKKLAKAKPHLLVADGEGEKTGSKFGGGRKTQDQLDDEALKAKYPALRRGS